MQNRRRLKTHLMRMRSADNRSLSNRARSTIISAQIATALDVIFAFVEKSSARKKRRRRLG